MKAIVIIKIEYYNISIEIKLKKRGIIMETKIKDKWLERIKLNAEEKTYQKYLTNISKIYKDFQKKIRPINELEMLKLMNHEIVYDYVMYELREKYMLATVNSYLATLQVFFDYIVVWHRKDIPYNPCEGLKQFKIDFSDRKKKVIPTKEEINKMISSCDIRKKGDRDFDFISSRDKVLISILAMNGSRIEEILQADMSMLEKIRDGYVINVNEKMTKNDISKRILIVGKSVGYFRDYLFERANQVKKINSNEEKIFISARGKKVETVDVNRMLKKVTEKANVRKFSSQSFRNFATASHIKNGTNETLIDLAIGWRTGMKEQYGTRSDLLKNYDMPIANIIQNFI